MQTWLSLLFYAAWLIATIHVVIILLMGHALVTELYQQSLRSKRRRYETNAG